MRWIKHFKSTFIFILVFFVTLELFSFVLTKNKLLLFNDTPGLYLKNRISDDENWRTEKSEWGAWHKYNHSFPHEKSCFNVIYKTNEVGARDDSFNLMRNKSINKNRYVLLGDSFAEGVGVEKEKISENILEKLLNADILNFGVGGSVGPVQYEIIYNNLAKKYPHDGVIIYFLPSNDFTDNDYQYWVDSGASYFKYSGNKNIERYRPYYKKSGSDEYDVFYPENGLKRDQWDYVEPSLGFFLKKFAVDHFWFSNVLLTIKQVVKSDLKFNPGIVTREYSGYFDATADQQKAAVYFMRRLIKSIEKPVTLVVIPRGEDFIRLSNGEKRENQFWYKEFIKLEKESGMKLIDLASHKPENINSLFLDCDGHWSEFGNEWAATQIASFMREKSN
jgi:hypothetical protein